MPLQFNLGAVYNQWVDFPAGAHLDITATITLCCWLNATSWPSSYYCDYLSKNNFYMLRVDDDDEPQFTLKLSDSNWHSVNGVVPVLTNIWYHIAGTYDKNAAGNNQIIYLNAVAQDSNRETLSILTDPTGTLSIGRNGAALAGDNARYFHGQIGDARIYNRALSAGEIKTIYACGGNDGIIQNMVFRSLLNEKNSGATSSGAGTVKDLSSHLNHGTSSNTPAYTAGILKYGRFIE